MNVAFNLKSDAGMALIRMVNRIENHHKCKAIDRIHGDRGQELPGDGAKQLLEKQGITVTSTAGYDSNANGREERAFFLLLGSMLQARWFVRSSNAEKEKYNLETEQRMQKLHVTSNQDKSK